MTEIPAGVATWARMPGPALVLSHVRARAARGAQTERGTLRVALTSEQRREMGRMLGVPWEVTGSAVRLQDLAAALAEHRLTVRGLVEALDGSPLVNLRQVRAEQREAAQIAAARERRTAADVLGEAGIGASAIPVWLDDGGLPKAGGGELAALVERVVAVWRRLPDPGRAVSLAELAAGIGEHDAHALDYDRPLGRAVARLIAAQHGMRRPLRPGRDWRQAWARMGVKCDGVSSRVLVLNLPLKGAVPAARWCAAAPGEPVWLTLRSITGWWAATKQTTVFVCENVTVLEAAADRLGADCPPMVCTDGNPTTAALDVIAGLAEAGCTVAVRADFDTAGWGIVKQVRSVAPAAISWQYDTATYAAQLGLDADHIDDGVEASAADGFDRLLALMLRCGAAVHEEAMLDELMADLDRGRSAEK